MSKELEDARNEVHAFYKEREDKYVEQLKYWKRRTHCAEDLLTPRFIKDLDICFVALASMWVHDFKTKVFNVEDFKKMYERSGIDIHNYDVDEDIIPAVKRLLDIQEVLLLPKEEPE
jgi:hypothetical protein